VYLQAAGGGGGGWSRDEIERLESRADSVLVETLPQAQGPAPDDDRDDLAELERGARALTSDAFDVSIKVALCGVDNQSGHHGPPTGAGRGGVAACTNATKLTNFIRDTVLNWRRTVTGR